MLRSSSVLIVIAMLLMLQAAACMPASVPATTVQATETAATPDAGATSGEAETTATVDAAATTEATEPAATTENQVAGSQTEGDLAVDAALPEFDPTRFNSSIQIDNQWLPLQPGTRWIYEGTTIDDEGNAVPHRVEITITDLTKIIGGVRAVVSWDLDYSDGELAEAELAFYAQDDEGNVWRMGEYPEEYDAGQVVASPTWIHGLAEARAGIHMQAHPELGTPSYAQGWGPAVDWTDRGQVDQMHQQVCVPVDCYEDVLVIAETSQAEPDAQQLKYYAPGVGNIRVTWRGEGEKTKETLELVELVQLSPDAMAEARTAARALEKSAYANSPDVYALTAPLE